MKQKIKTSILVVLSLAILVIIPTTAYSLPELQVNIVSAANSFYDTYSEGMTTSSSSFEVQIFWDQAKALSPIHVIFALDKLANPNDGAITTTLDGTSTQFTDGDFVWGNPTDGFVDPANFYHSVYETNYVKLLVDETLFNPFQIYNVDPSEDQAPVAGLMASIMVEVAGFESVHIDAMADRTEPPAEGYVFAPASKDGDFRRVPEPATMLLLGNGLMLLCSLKRKETNN